MGGYLSDHAPLDDGGFLAYARGMGAPQFARIVEHAEPLTDLTRFRFPSSVRRRYERLRQFPRGLLVFGDAICSFNPVYGQGITVAAMEALALREELRRGTDRLAQRFFRRAARIIDSAWMVVTGTDARILDITEHNTLANRVLGKYLDTLHVAAKTDPQVANAFLRVANLMTEPTTLLTPSMLWRVRRAYRAQLPG
jgi:2-polyprenyl-6-methoxyphenol hydroxylase-like FAD-dependent oxidoreductase